MTPELTNTGLSMGDERLMALIRRFSHDVRNHLNGVEMEIALLEDVISDPEGLDAVGQLRKDSAGIEILLRSLLTRFQAPERQPVPVVDTFYLWQTRARSHAPDSSIEWECNAESEIIEIDMKMIADAMGELVRHRDTTPSRAIVESSNSGITFEVRWRSDEGGADTPGAIRLPEFETVIERNGGRFENDQELGTGEHFVRCWFPLYTENS